MGASQATLQSSEQEDLIPLLDEILDTGSFPAILEFLILAGENGNRISRSVEVQAQNLLDSLRKFKEEASLTGSAYWKWACPNCNASNALHRDACVSCGGTANPEEETTTKGSTRGMVSRVSIPRTYREFACVLLDQLAAVEQVMQGSPSRRLIEDPIVHVSGEAFALLGELLQVSISHGFPESSVGAVLELVTINISRLHSARRGASASLRAAVAAQLPPLLDTLCDAQHLELVDWEQAAEVMALLAPHTRTPGQPGGGGGQRSTRRLGGMSGSSNSTSPALAKPSPQGSPAASPTPPGGDGTPGAPVQATAGTAAQGGNGGGSGGASFDASAAAGGGLLLPSRSRVGDFWRAGTLASRAPLSVDASLDVLTSFRPTAAQRASVLRRLAQEMRGRPAVARQFRERQGVCVVLAIVSGVAVTDVRLMPAVSVLLRLSEQSASVRGSILSMGVPATALQLMQRSPDSSLIQTLGLRVLCSLTFTPEAATPSSTPATLSQPMVTAGPVKRGGDSQPFFPPTAATAAAAEVDAEAGDGDGEGERKEEAGPNGSSPGRAGFRKPRNSRRASLPPYVVADMAYDAEVVKVITNGGVSVLASALNVSARHKLIALSLLRAVASSGDEGVLQIAGCPSLPSVAVVIRSLVSRRAALFSDGSWSALLLPLLVRAVIDITDTQELRLHLSAPVVLPLARRLFWAREAHVTRLLRLLALQLGGTPHMAKEALAGGAVAAAADAIIRFPGALSLQVAACKLLRLALEASSGGNGGNEVVTSIPLDALAAVLKNHTEAAKLWTAAAHLLATPSNLTFRTRVLQKVPGSFFSLLMDRNPMDTELHTRCLQLLASLGAAQQQAAAAAKAKGSKGSGDASSPPRPLATPELFRVAVQSMGLHTEHDGVQRAGAAALLALIGPRGSGGGKVSRKEGSLEALHRAVAHFTARQQQAEEEVAELLEQRRQQLAGGTANGISPSQRLVASASLVVAREKVRKYAASRAVAEEAAERARKRGSLEKMFKGSGSRKQSISTRDVGAAAGGANDSGGRARSGSVQTVKRGSKSFASL